MKSIFYTVTALSVISAMPSVPAWASGAAAPSSILGNMALVSHVVVYNDSARGTSPGPGTYMGIGARSCMEELRGAELKPYSAEFGANCRPVSEPYCTSWIQPVVMNTKEIRGEYDLEFTEIHDNFYRSSIVAEFRSIPRTDLFQGLYIASAGYPIGDDGKVSLPRMMESFDEILFNIPNTVMSELENDINGLRQSFQKAAQARKGVAMQQLTRMSALVNGLILANQRCADLDANHTKLMDESVEVFKAELLGQLRQFVVKKSGKYNPPHSRAQA